MPAKSQSQRKLIYAKRNQYGSKAKTPEKWKWVWGEDWENKGKLPKKAKRVKETVQNYISKDRKLDDPRTYTVKVHENYPLGSANDPKAPWNQNNQESVEVDMDEHGNVELIRKIQISEDDWETEKEIISSDTIDQFLAKYLKIDLDVIEEPLLKYIKDNEDGYMFITEYGFVNVSFDDLDSLPSFIYRK